MPLSLSLRPLTPRRASVERKRRKACDRNDIGIKGRCGQIEEHIATLEKEVSAASAAVARADVRLAETRAEATRAN